MRHFAAGRLRRRAVGLQYRAFAVRVLSRNEHPDPYSLEAIRNELVAKAADAAADVITRLADALERR